MSDLRADFMTHAAGLPQPPRTIIPRPCCVGGAVLVSYVAALLRAGCHAWPDLSPVSAAWATSSC